VYQEQKEAGGVLQAAGVGLEGLGSFEGNVMVVPGNMPLLQPETTLLCLEAMIAEGAAGSQVGVLRPPPLFQIHPYPVTPDPSPCCLLYYSSISLHKGAVGAVRGRAFSPS